MKSFVDKSSKKRRHSSDQRSNPKRSGSALWQLEDKRNDALAQMNLAKTIHNGPQQTVQRRLMNGLHRQPAQTHASADAELLQRMESEDEELLQGRFETLQRQTPEEEVPLQGGFESAQRQGMEEEEPLQGRFETVQRQQSEDEELLQGRFSCLPVQMTSESSQNRTGLPDNLKTGIENLSGYSMDDVSVHYNSSKPAQLQAHAYAQGTNIHLASGQEKHLPHEAWHVVQQKQGRVRPTIQMKAGKPVNDDPQLEKEADVMGTKAFQSNSILHDSHLPKENEIASTNIFQRYERVDLDESQTWDMVRGAFKSFKPEMEATEVEVGKIVINMKYTAGSPDTSSAKVSDGGKLAINADGESQHRVFFLSKSTLSKSNSELRKARSDFLLEPTGVVMKVYNHPDSGDKSTLFQVKAAHVDGDEAAIELATRCDLFYKNITKAHEEFLEILKTTEHEGLDNPIPSKRRRAIDQRLEKVALSAGDAFEIKGFGESVGVGWNEHYAGIVAVDSGDQVTLENYNRNAEMTDKVEPLLKKIYGEGNENGFLIQGRITALRKELDETGFFSRTKKGELKSKIADLEKLLKQVSDSMSSVNAQKTATHYFAMYGPATKGQSFLDVWRAHMDSQQSSLKISKSIKD